MDVNGVTGVDGVLLFSFIQSKIADDFMAWDAAVLWVFKQILSKALLSYVRRLKLDVTSILMQICYMKPWMNSGFGPNRQKKEGKF